MSSSTLSVVPPLSPASSCSSTTTTSKTPCVVRFSRKVQVRTTLHLDDYLDEEAAACWYTPHEMYTIRRINLKAVELMENGSISPQRGLEVHTEAANRLRQFAKMRVRNAVLQEQHDSEYEWYDDEAIARASRAESMESRMQAMVTGMSDALWLTRHLESCRRKGETILSYPNSMQVSSSASVCSKDDKNRHPMLALGAASASDSKRSERRTIAAPTAARIVTSRVC